MMKRYLIQLRDRDQTDFLDKCGYIVHVSRLSNIVVFEADEKCEKVLGNHPNVYKIEKDDTFELAMK